jgi:hypothetical protein
MDRAMLADHIAVADFDATFNFRFEAEVLRPRSEDGAVADEVSGAHVHRSFNDDVRLDDAVFPDDSARADYGIGADLHIATELRAGVDNRCWVNFHSTPASLKLKYDGRPSAGAPMII